MGPARASTPIAQRTSTRNNECTPRPTSENWQNEFGAKALNP